MGQQVVDEKVEDADDDPLWMFRIDPGLKLLYGSVGGKCWRTLSLWMGKVIIAYFL